MKPTVGSNPGKTMFLPDFANWFEAGLTYCAIGALSFLGKIPGDFLHRATLNEKRDIAFEECVHCIVSRQSTYLEEVNDEDPLFDIVPATSDSLVGTSSAVGDLPHLGPLAVGEEPRELPPPPLNIRDEDVQYVGFNGRPNKVVDTCYSFWNLGSLAVCLHDLALPPTLTSSRSYIE